MTDPSHAIPAVDSVRLDDPHDVALWALVMGVEPERIVEVGKRVGNDPKRIKDELFKSP